ncbi:helix-turn-helix domain-containing protein [Natrarchaeobaculum sulfurireducens]|uniref:Bacterio-opsin activator domain-containing protein n=1 Tax=Natrarchaeobaculum sulfurireducens TaxID=2044521 RepID=A0A346PLX9_9EURY|nr:helix-turn-helix domain-containing protein [Natrarchaeobaculum sulfurireducens]AXR80524.1 Bacterio-opsin activator domain-containing protein [Natrarchaeobaculum sulfurireducens]
MSLITEVRFAHEDGVLADTLTALPDLSVDIVREASTAPDKGVYFFRFDHAHPEEVRPLLESDHTVSVAERVPAVDDQHLWKIALTSETKLLAPAVTVRGGVVLDARSALTNTEPRGWRERWFFPDDDGIHEIWNHARAADFEFEVLDLSRQLQPDVPHVEVNPVTDEQHRALLTAYELGYFEEPRKTSLEELAAALDLSPSAVNGRLRRGLKSLIGAAFTVDVEDEVGRTDGEPHARTESSHSRW